MTCPLCGSAAPFGFLERLGVPVHQNILCPDAASARNVTRGDLRLAVCPDCGFVFNTAFDASKLSYGADYDNNQICSSAFSRYVDELVEHIVSARGVRDALIVEVGCGKGYFLRRLVEHPRSNNAGIGFDPTYLGPASDLDGRLRFERTFYDERSQHVRPDAVVCRHVIEHVADPGALLTSIRRALGPQSRARVFFETPCVEWILKNDVAWDFFYEHCSLFSQRSLSTAFALAGFDVCEVRPIFGEQYLWIEAVVSQRAEPPPRGAGSMTAALAERFGASELRRLEHWQERLHELGQRGGVAIWGAGAKGATLANLADPDQTAVRCVVDMNPAKQGKFVPGTGHPIIGPDALDEYAVTTALLMNPNYRSEIAALLHQRGSRIELVDQGL